MHTENDYARKPFAALINKLPQTSWIYNANTTVTNGEVSSHAYVRGLPDGFIFSRGRVVCIEHKAFWGACYLGNPDDPDDGRGFAYHQRAWWRNVAVATGTPYFINLWVHKDRKKEGRTFQTDAVHFLIPPEAWLALESRAYLLGGVRTIGLTQDHIRVKAHKELALMDNWAKYIYHSDDLAMWLDRAIFTQQELESKYD